MFKTGMPGRLDSQTPKPLLVFQAASAFTLDGYAHGRYVSLLGPMKKVDDVAVVLSERIRDSLPVREDATDVARIPAPSAALTKHQR